MQLFWTIPDFWSSIATLDIFFRFLDVFLMVLEEDEVICSFPGIRQAQWWHFLKEVKTPSMRQIIEMGFQKFIEN